jgi:hypothetical protein
LKYLSFFLLNENALFWNICLFVLNDNALFWNICLFVLNDNALFWKSKYVKPVVVKYKFCSTDGFLLLRKNYCSVVRFGFGISPNTHFTVLSIVLYINLLTILGLSQCHSKYTLYFAYGYSIYRSCLKLKPLNLWKL